MNTVSVRDRLLDSTKSVLNDFIKEIDIRDKRIEQLEKSIKDLEKKNIENEKRIVGLNANIDNLMIVNRRLEDKNTSLQLYKEEVNELKEKIKTLQNSTNINESLLKNKTNDASGRYSRYGLDLLELYFIRGNKRVKELLDDIINGLIPYDMTMSKTTATNMLFIAMVNNKDEDIIERFESVSELLKYRTNDNVIYNTYYNIMEDPTEKKAKELYRLIENSGFTYLDSSLQGTVRVFIKSSLNKMIKNKTEENKKVKINENMVSPIEVKIRSKCEDYDTYDEYMIISKKKLKCVRDSKNLTHKMIYLIKYKDKKYSTVDRKVKTYAHICTECNVAYLTQDQCEILKRQWGKAWYKQINLTKEKAVAVEPVNTINVAKELKHRNDSSSRVITVTLNQQSKVGVTQGKVDTNNEVQLRDSSALADLGYSTTLSRETRWNILRNKAIPRLGKERTKYIINRLINYNGKSKRMQRALIEWKHDLDRLNSL